MLSMRQVLTLILLLTAFLYASVVIVEMPDDDARPVFVANVVDGDTVEVSDSRRVRLVGYDAYELSEPLGARARQELRSLCLGKAYLDVDDLEPLDRYGRILGYMWCRRGVGNITWYVSVQKHFIIGDGRRYVKRLSRRTSLHPVDLLSRIFQKASDAEADFSVYARPVCGV
jgi:hypothetical protein